MRARIRLSIHEAGRFSISGDFRLAARTLAIPDLGISVTTDNAIFASVPASTMDSHAAKTSVAGVGTTRTHPPSMDAFSARAFVWVVTRPDLLVHLWELGFHPAWTSWM